MTRTDPLLRAICCAAALAVGGCTVKTGGGGSSTNTPAETAIQVSAAAEAACIPTCTAHAGDVQAMYGIIQDHHALGMSSANSIDNVLTQIEGAPLEAGGGPAGRESCEPCVDTIASEIFAEDIAPPDQEEDDLDVTFPDSAGTVMLVQDPDANFSAAFYGSTDPEAGAVLFTGLSVDSGDAQADLDVTLDDQQRPTQLTLGSLVLTVTYNADGSADVEARDNGEVVLTLPGLFLDDTDLDEILPGLDADSGATKVTACELPMDGEVARRAAQVRVFDPGVHPVVACAEDAPKYVVRGILARHGYKNVDSVENNHPLAECLSRSDLARVLSNRFCFLEVILAKPVRNAVYAQCRKSHQSEKYWEYCTRLADEATAAIDRAERVIASSLSGVADALWDDPDCRCPAKPCPSNLVCTDGQCVPKCTRDDDCPGEKVCVADGQCVTGDGAGGEGEGEGEGEDVQFTAEALAGCWTVEITPDVGGDVSQFIYDIDDTGRLECVWAYFGPPDFDLQPGEVWIETGEFMRFTVPNAGVQGDASISTEQFVATDDDSTRVTINWGFRSYVFRGCTMWSTATTEYKFLISDATLSGSPPDRFENGAFESPRETTGTVNGESAYAEENTTGTADGWRTQCPDPAAPEVESQEEYAATECDSQ
ncbi:MAG TPA: EB domain-containing protein [Phycisphaerae bacterium]|nr:EB domain-containing protein [Phycisphaerae bacterium]